MARTYRNYDSWVDQVERQERLSKRGKLPSQSKSRRSDRIRAVADSWREEIEMSLGDDDVFYNTDYDEIVELT